MIGWLHRDAGDLPSPARRRALGSLVEEGTELLQSVANDVAPWVVEAIDVDGVIRRIDIQAVVERVDLNRGA